MPRHNIDLPETLSRIPDQWLDTPYVYARDPSQATFDDPVRGANCQLFAYAVLKLYGLYVPPYRSSNLWEDTEYTQVVDEPRPLDLVFVHNKPEPYGAHLGVYAGDDQVLHLSKQVGVPAIWSMNEFAQHPKYNVLIGFKRALQEISE